MKQGEIVTLVGSNGAGKTTLLRAISGVQPVASGTIRLDGEAINSHVGACRASRAASPRCRKDARCSRPLTVDDNLRLGAYRRRDAEVAADLDKVYATFPALAEQARALPPARCRAASSRCWPSAAR